jgi:hypothetical protein
MPEQPSGRVRDKANAFRGQMSGLPIESYGITSAEQVKNFLLKDGQLKKINGSQIYAEVLGAQAGGIVSLHRFKELWVAQRGSALAFEAFEGTGAFAETLKTDLLSNARLFSCTWRDRIFFTNTTDTDMCLNRPTGSLGPSKYGRLSIDPPPYAPFNPGSSYVVPATPGNIPGGATAPGITYYYFITLLDAETNSESPASGAQIGQNGLYELSPNGVLGPIPIATVLMPNATTGEIAISGATALIPYLAGCKVLVPRATHFIIYRAIKVPGGTLYEDAARVPLKNGSPRQDGNYIIDIQQFIDEGTDFVDNTAAPPAVPLPTNNSCAPTPARELAAYNQAKLLGITVGDFDPTQTSGFRHMKVFRDQLFGIGAKSPGYYVKEISYGSDQQRVTGTINDFSDLLHGSEVYQPDYMTYIWEVGRGDGQAPIALSVLSDVALLIHKEKSTYYLSGSSPDNFVLRIMDTQKGCVHQGTQRETPAGAITLDRGGFVLWSKIGLGERISASIQDVIDSIQFQYSSNFYSCYDPKYNRYYCAVAVPGSSGNPNMTLCLDLNSMGWTYTQGTEGLSREIDTNSSDIFVDLTGSSGNGRLVDFSYEKNVTNQGEAIEASWKSGTINFGDDQRKKKMQWIYLRAKSLSSWKVDIYVIPDYDMSRAWVLPDVDATAFQSTWFSSDMATDGNLFWDDGSGGVGGNWASDGLTRQVLKIPVKCIGYTFQIMIVHKETDPDRASFAIESVSAEGVAFGR